MDLIMTMPFMRAEICAGSGKAGISAFGSKGTKLVFERKLVFFQTYISTIEVTFMEFLPINTQNRQEVNAFIANRWFSTDMIIRSAIIDMTKADGIIASENGGIIGLLTYIIGGGVCEITSLDSLREGIGIGTALISRMISIAKERGCRRIIVVTTNDNINAIRFYQKRGFDMTKLYRNSLDISRKLKPDIPLIGDNGILLKHEIEFEYTLTRGGNDGR